MSAALGSLMVADRTAEPGRADHGARANLAAAGTIIIGAAFQVVAFALIPDFDDTESDGSGGSRTIRRRRRCQ